MQEICWDFPEAVANYVYVQDQENFFEKTHWLGHPQCNNWKSWLEEAINWALRYGLLWEANELPNYTDELDFTGDAEKRYVRLNEMLKGFIKLDFSDKPFLIYSMDC